MRGRRQRPRSGLDPRRPRPLPGPQTALDLFAESGRGLVLVRELSQGHCRAYATTTFATEAPAKAIAFALPTRSGIRLTCPPLLRLGRRSVRLQLTDPADTAERGQDG
ncbi:hypothetical protein ABZ260_32835 [Streptosporangium sp. NPDC006013]|uniref:hypothetical protein n=1 Tax=Streptosporangium sp. NPDC006013 TaxID=3155596 RepID=UPI0033AB78A2